MVEVRNAVRPVVYKLPGQHFLQRQHVASELIGRSLPASNIRPVHLGLKPSAHVINDAGDVSGFTLLLGSLLCVFPAERVDFFEHQRNADQRYCPLILGLFTEDLVKLLHHLRDRIADKRYARKSLLYTVHGNGREVQQRIDAAYDEVCLAEPCVFLKEMGSFEGKRDVPDNLPEYGICFGVQADNVVADFAKHQTSQREQQSFIACLIEVGDLILKEPDDLWKLLGIFPVEEVGKTVLDNPLLCQPDDIEAELAGYDLLSDDGKGKRVAELDKFVQFQR